MSTRFLSLHALHAMPASLLNRDDMGATKVIPYGGVTRVRVSSQSWKRALREYLRSMTIRDGAFGLRTVRLPELAAEVLAATGRDQQQALAKTVAAVGSVFTIARKGATTSVLVFMHQQAPQDVAAIVDQHWDDLSDDNVPAAVTLAVKQALDPGNAIDIALFGRFLAELDGMDVAAAVHVNHAFSVDPARITPDFFTAVDDSAGDADPMSSNLGVTDVSAPVLYRHAALDRDQLARNLNGDDTLAQAAETALVEAFLSAVPTAKQASTAASTFPSFIVGVVSGRDTSVADAFVDPVSAPVLTNASAALAGHLAKVSTFIPGGARVVVMPVTADPAGFQEAGFQVVSGIEAFMEALR